MMTRGWRWTWLGLGLILAGAVLQRPLHAQGTRDTVRTRRDSTTLAVPLPPRADSLLKDSLAKIARRDSIRKAQLADTIKAPLAHGELPADLGIAKRLHWTRDSLFATGALTVADLLERVPGMTTLHAGWIAAPAVGAYLGDVRRVRVFMDGFEYLPLDPRGGGALDLTQINLWGAEEASVEQGPEEVRVYLRSWRVRNTTPETRTDVSTGDQQTNMYRGFFGRRFTNGTALQFAAQQYGTNPGSALGGSSDQTGIVGRVGWAKRQWSVDGFITRISRHRGVIYHEAFTGFTATPNDSLLAVNSSRGDAYVRVGFADPDTSAIWWQAMAVTSKYDYTGVRTKTILNPKTAADSAFNTSPLDTATTRTQLLLTGGTTRGPLRLSGAERIISGGGRSFAVPSVRAAFAESRLTASAFVEGKSVDSVSRMDVSAQFAPTSFVAVLGSVGRATDSRVKDSSFTAKYARGEVGLRLRNLWLLGGMIRRDSVRLAAPSIYNPTNTDSAYVRQSEGAATGATVAVRGQLWRLIHADLSAVRWNDSAGFYRPRYQTRSELFVRTNLLDRFPTNDLGILFSLVHEYRSGVHFPVAGNVVTVPGYRTVSSLLEIRILSATISWQFRNFLGERYQQVPGLLMPRQTNFYGVRWSFFD